MIKNENTLKAFQEIEFKVGENNKTYASKVFFEKNIRFSPSIDWDTTDEIKYFTIHIGGGYISGESYGQNIVLQENADAVVMTHSSTKVFKNIPGKEYSKQLTDVHLAKNTVFQFYNDSIIAYETAKYFQKSNFYMDKTSTLIYTDIMGPGWSESGKKFSFEKVWTLNKMFINDEPYLLDNFRIDTTKDDIRSVGFFDKYDYMATLISYSQKISRKTVDALYEYIKEHNENKENTQISISYISNNGLILRIFANFNYDVKNVQDIAINWLRKNLLNREPILKRKY